MQVGDWVVVPKHTNKSGQPVRGWIAGKFINFVSVRPINYGKCYSLALNYSDITSDEQIYLDERDKAELIELSLATHDGEWFRSIQGDMPERLG